MPERKKKTHKPSALAQFTINVVIPLIILTRFSGEQHLGPTGGLLAALAFPAGYEMYNIWKRGKVSALSIIAIGGILATGLIGLLGLSENWLAVRRSFIYAAGALGVWLSVIFNKPAIEFLLRQVVDLERVRRAAKIAKSLAKLERVLKITNYAAVALLVVMAVASYVLTKFVIDAPTDSTLFNEQYARLRVISTFVITGPLLIGFVSIISAAIFRLEKLSGLELEELMKKK